MLTYNMQSTSTEATMKIAAKLASLLQPGDVITLEGDLGVGKTTFTKGLAQGLGVNRMVTSPTFTIVKEYEGRLPLYHMDVYRLEDSDEDIGFLEYFNGTGVTVIEWAQFIEEFLPSERLDVVIIYKNEHTRELQFKANGDHYEEIIKTLMTL